MHMVNLTTGASVDLPPEFADIMTRLRAGGPVNEFEEAKLADFLMGEGAQEEDEGYHCEVCALMAKAASAESSFDALTFAKAARTLAETMVTMEGLGG